jgi:hypothetical protein
MVTTLTVATLRCPTYRSRLSRLGRSSRAGPWSLPTPPGEYWSAPLLYAGAIRAAFLCISLIVAVVSFTPCFHLCAWRSWPLADSESFLSMVQAHQHRDASS